MQSPPRRIPLQMQMEVNEIIKDMKDQGVIDESTSPWTSPMILIKKNDGTMRFCVNFRKINAVTIKDSYLIITYYLELTIFSTSYQVTFGLLL